MLFCIIDINSMGKMTTLVAIAIEETLKNNLTKQKALGRVIGSFLCIGSTKVTAQ